MITSLHQARGARAEWTIAVALALVMPASLRANPDGPAVVHGTAHTTTVGSQMTVTTSDRSYIEWRSFNIGIGESTRFVQPSASSISWNRIDDANPSQIFGHLDANGILVLQNQSGLYIGPHAALNVQGLIMTTAPI